MILAIAGIICLTFLLVLLIAAWASKKPDEKAAAIAQRAVRHLDRAIDNPLDRQGPGWESVAREIVDDYYGKRD